MVRPIDTAALRELLDRGAQLVEVLPAKEFEEEHLPGARNLPLEQLTRERALAELDVERPVVAYCFDYQ